MTERSAELRTQPLVNGNPPPDGVTLNDWMRLHLSPGFYDWLNAIHGCGKWPQTWRLDTNIGWCGV